MLHYNGESVIFSCNPPLGSFDQFSKLLLHPQHWTLLLLYTANVLETFLKKAHDICVRADTFAWLLMSGAPVITGSPPIADELINLLLEPIKRGVNGRWELVFLSFKASRKDELRMQVITQLCYCFKIKFGISIGNWLSNYKLQTQANCKCTWTRLQLWPCP